MVKYAEASCRARGRSLAFRPLIAALLASTLMGCDGSSGREPRIPYEPPGPAGDFQPIIHTLDGRHLAFKPGDFEPRGIEHCREDGNRHLTSIFELSAISPAGKTESLCPELAGRFVRLNLQFVEETLIKATTICENGCVEPGGYYPPLGAVIRIPWSEIAMIEFRR